MLTLRNCTAICVDTINYEQSRWAAEHCSRAANFHDILILTDVCTGAQTRPIPTITSFHGYNEFVLNKLVEYCETEFALVFQWDGFIVRPDRWNTDFMRYDYVGAPWFRGEFFDAEVGNGGFSLRSRRLLEACATRHMPMEVNEDEFVCRTIIPENPELRAAPVELARAFSVENDLWSGDSFGFHGSWHFPQFMKDEEVIERLLIQAPYFWTTRQAIRWIEAAVAVGKTNLARSLFDLCRALQPDVTADWCEGELL